MGLYFFVDMLYIAKEIIIPVVVATVIAVLLRPVVDFFVKRRMKRLLAVIITLFITVATIIVLGALIISQATRFSESLPKLAEKLQGLLDHAATWLSGYFKLSNEEIKAWLMNARRAIVSSLALKNTLLSMGNVLVIFILAPTYVFMILLYQPLLVDFVYKVFGTKNNSSVKVVLTEANSLIQSYLIGLLIEMAIIATLNSIGLLVLGMPYAILLGVLGALLNLIPYLGNIATTGIYMLVALVAKESALYVLYILILYAVVHFLDNNLIVPKILGSRVKLNALASFIAIISGAVLWGIAGMFLAIPLTAIIKVVCDHTQSMKPLGRLLGDTMPPFATRGD